MRAAGIIRKMDKLGRIVFPSELRRSLHMSEGVDIEIFADDTYIYIKKYESACIYCGEMKDTFNYKGRNICPDCLLDIQNVKPLQKHRLAL